MAATYSQSNKNLSRLYGIHRATWQYLLAKDHYSFENDDSNRNDRKRRQEQLVSQEHNSGTSWVLKMKKPRKSAKKTKKLQNGKHPASTRRRKRRMRIN